MDKAERKLNAIKREMEESLIAICRAARAGEHVITVRVFCGEKGGISRARVGVHIDGVVGFD